MESKNRLEAFFHFDKEQYVRENPDAIDGFTEPTPYDQGTDRYIKHIPNKVRITSDNIKTAIGDVHQIGDYAVIIKRVEPFHAGQFEDCDSTSKVSARLYSLGISMTATPVRSNTIEEFGYLSWDITTLNNSLLDREGLPEDRARLIRASIDEMANFNPENFHDIDPEEVYDHLDEYFDHAAAIARDAAKDGYWIKNIELDSRTWGLAIRPDKEITGSGLMRGIAWLSPEDLDKNFGGDPKAADKALEDAFAQLNYLEHRAHPEYELYAAPVISSERDSVRIAGGMQRVSGRIRQDHALRDALESLTPQSLEDALKNGSILSFDGSGKKRRHPQKHVFEWEKSQAQERQGGSMRIFQTITTQAQAVFSISGLVDKAGKAISHLMEAKYNPQAFAALQKENPDQLKKDLGAFYRWGCEIAARNLADAQPATARERQESLATMKMAASNGRLTLAQRVKRWFKHNEKNSGLSKTAAQIANIADQRYEAAAIVAFLKENGIEANQREFRSLSGDRASVQDFRNEFICKMVAGQNGEAMLQKFDDWMTARLGAGDHMQSGKSIVFQGDGKGEQMRETAADVVVSKFITPHAAEMAAKHPEGLSETDISVLQEARTDAIVKGQLAQEHPVVASVNTLYRVVPAPKTEAALEREVGKVVQEVMPAPEPYKPDPWLQERQAKIDKASAISWEMREIANNLGVYPRTYLGDETTPQGKPITVQGVNMSIDLEHLDMETGGRLDELMGPRVAALREAARQYALTKAAEKYDYCSYDAEKNEFRIAGRLYDPVNLTYVDAAANDDMAALSASMPLIPELTLLSIRLTAEIDIRQCFNSDREASKQYCQTYSMKVPVPDGIEDMPAFRESDCKIRNGQAFLVSRCTVPTPEIPSADVALEMLEDKSAKFFNHEAIAAARKEFAEAERQRAEEAMNGRQEEEERTGMAMGM